MRACANYLCAQNMRCMSPSNCMSVMGMPMSAPQGWPCPKCGSVWSPTTPGCFTCNKPKQGHGFAPASTNGERGA